MPNLYRRGRVWWCWGYDRHGKKWQRTTRQRDKSAAAKVARRIEGERAAATDAAPYPLAEAIAALREHKRRMKRSDATMEQLDCKGGHLLRVFGRRRDVTALTLADLEHYIDRRRAEDADLSDHTIHMELSILRQALRLANRHGRYPFDVAAIWPDAMRNVYTPRDRWLPLAEYEALLAAMAPRYSYEVDRRDYVVVYCHLGLSYSELYRIEARHLDRGQRMVHVEGTKTVHRDRTIPCSEAAWQVLERRAAAHPMGPLFPSKWYRHKMVAQLAAACERAGIAPVSANDLRRTFASWLANAGVPEGVTAKLMGHSNSTMVRRVYAQLAPQTLRQAVSRLPAAVPGGVPDRHGQGREITDSADKGGGENAE